MQRVFMTFILICFSLLATSCKVAVIVVEGGEVHSTVSGTCLAGSICIVDVDNTDFSEIFMAVPGKGWYFRKWNRGGRFLCGGSLEMECRLSFQGKEESEKVGEVVASSETFYLMPIFLPYRDIVTVNGREWLQPSLFNDLSWNDIDAVCPEGSCKGMLNGVDVTGWRWASIDEVKALLHYYIGNEVLASGEDYFFDLISAWGPKFFNDGLAPLVDTEYILEGWTSSRYDDPNEPNNAYFVNIHYKPGIDDPLYYEVDEIRIGWTELYSRAPEGAWFYRMP